MQPYAIEIKASKPSGWPEYNRRAALIGEAPGADEVIEGHPFVGRAGQLLDHWLKRAGMRRKRVLISNIFRQRPENNQIAKFFIKPQLASEQEIEIWARLGEYPGLGYPYAEYKRHFHALRKLLQEQQPQVIFAIGRTASWALTGKTELGTNFGKRRDLTPFWKYGAPVVPIYHPAYILRTHDTQLERRIVRTLRKHTER